MLPVERAKFGYNFIFEQDNASVYTSKYTIEWFKKRNGTVLPWPTNSPDLSHIENLWSVVARRWYRGGKRYNNVQGLPEAIEKEFSEISSEYTDTLYPSFSLTFISVLKKKEGFTKY